MANNWQPEKSDQLIIYRGDSQAKLCHCGFTTPRSECFQNVGNSAIEWAYNVNKRVCLHVSIRGKRDRKRSEIRGSAAQGRLDQSRWPRKDPSKPVRFVARFLRAHLPESHSRGAARRSAGPLPVNSSNDSRFGWLNARSWLFQFSDPIRTFYSYLTLTRHSIACLNLLLS